MTAQVTFFRSCKDHFWPKMLFSASGNTDFDARAFFYDLEKFDGVALELFPFQKKAITSKKVFPEAEKNQKHR